MICRKVILGSVASLAVSTVAFADEGSTHNWGGGYIGAHTGGAFETQKSSWAPVGTCSTQAVCFGDAHGGLLPYVSENGPGNTPTLPILVKAFHVDPSVSTPSWPTTLRSSGTQGVIGLTFGYNYQGSSNLVLGIDNQLSFTLGRSASARWQNQNTYSYTYLSYAIDDIRQDSFSTNQRLNWLDMFAARFGIAYGQTLFFVKAGLAFGDVKSSTQAGSLEEVDQSFNGRLVRSINSDATWSGSNHQLRAGLALGGGLEQALSDQLSVRLDATYFTLGSAHVTSTGTTQITTFGTFNVPNGVQPVQSYRISQKIDGLIVSIGLSYRY